MNHNTWLRDIIVGPLFVGAIIALLSFLLPRFLGESRELSFVVDESAASLDGDAIGSATIKINDQIVPEIYVIRLRIRNSGSMPLKQVPVLAEFASPNPAFRVLSVSHNTTPEREFGAITDDKGDSISKRFIYELLNPDDVDNIAFLTTAKATVKIFAKAEALTVKQEFPDKPFRLTWYFAAIIAMMASLTSNLFEAGVKSWKANRR